VLVADDDPGARNLLTLTLQVEGHEVLEAKNGQEALTLLAEHPELDLLVLDLMMPTLDGWAVLRELPDEGPRVIVISGVSGGFEERELAPPHLLVRSMKKPYSFDDLVGAIQEALGPSPADDPGRA
jgi:CheY-like chemotaxis protein